VKNLVDIGAIVAIAGTLILWVRFAMDVRNFRVREEKRRRDDEEHLEELIVKVCEAFTNSDSYLLRRDRAMIQVAQSVTEEAFRLRASSFVDSAVDAERHRELNRRIESIEKAVIDMRADFSEAAGKIASEVTLQVSRLLKDGR
jgi:hypothetical protein